MKIITIFFGLLLTSLGQDTSNVVDLSSVTLCAILNNTYRTFANIWEIDKEFKATGQFWVPVAINACPLIYSNCSGLNPVCAVAEQNFYKTFPNECALEAERSSTGIEWHILFNGICFANSVEGLANSKIDAPVTQAYNNNKNNQYYENSPSERAHSISQVATSSKAEVMRDNYSRNKLTSYSSNLEAQDQDRQDSTVLLLPSPSEGQYNTNQKILQSYPEPVQSFANERLSQSTPQLSSTSITPPLPGHQIAAQTQTKHTSVTYNLSPTYDASAQILISSGHLSSNNAIKHNSGQLISGLGDYRTQLGVLPVSTSINSAPNDLGSSGQPSAGLIGEYQSSESYSSSSGLTAADAIPCSRAHTYISPVPEQHYFVSNSQTSNSNISLKKPSHSNEFKQKEDTSNYPNQVLTQPPSEEVKPTYHVSSNPVTGDYNPVQLLPSYSKPKPTLEKGNSYQNPSQLSGSSVHSARGEIKTHIQHEQDSLASHIMSASPGYPETEAPVVSGPLNQKPVQIIPDDLNQISPQVPVHLASHLSSSYYSSSSPAAGQYNTNQQPQSSPNYIEQMQNFLIENSNSNSAQILESPKVQAEHDSYSSAPMDYKTVQPANSPASDMLLNYVEDSVQTLSREDFLKSSGSLSSSIDSSLSAGQFNSVAEQQPLATFPASSTNSIHYEQQNDLAISPTLPTANNLVGSNGEPDREFISDAQLSQTYSSPNDVPGSESGPYSAAQVIISPEHDQIPDSQTTDNSYPGEASNTLEAQQYSNELNSKDYSSQATQGGVSDGQTIYNGVVFQGPYYYQPEYKHYYFGHLLFPSASQRLLDGAMACPNSYEPIAGIQDYASYFALLLKQLKHVVSGSDKLSY